MSEASQRKYTELHLVTATGEEIPVTGNSFTIGRSGDCHFQPASILISRRHALILRESDGDYLQDWASTSGIWLGNERLVGRHKLREGDEFRLADVMLRVRFR
ncbi:FHA domain-containing protein [Archangium violaceum]|uniref:FHA domain-containing protein n=1 Tax=Archangium violaceum TaxID=83451 RepID=UPI0036DF2D40